MKSQRGGREGGVGERQVDRRGLRAGAFYMDLPPGSTVKRLGNAGDL